MTVTDTDAPVTGALHASGIASWQGLSSRHQHGPWLWDLLPDATRRRIRTYGLAHVDLGIAQGQGNPADMLAALRRIVLLEERIAADLLERTWGPY